MPFIIVKGGSCPASRPYGVYTEAGGHGTGKPKGSPHGCHPTREKAVAQLRALYVNVPEAKSAAPSPPNLREAEPTAAERCGSCKMYDHETSTCWGYGNVRVEPHQVCDSYSPEPEPEAKSAGTEVPMSATASPVSKLENPEWRRERAQALSESQRKRTETRQVHEPLELREATEDGKRVLRSYASVFDSPYTIRTSGYRFEEVVRPGAFKRTLGTNPDVVFRTEHSGPPLAATWSGDLRLGEDARGLWYEVDLDESDPDVKSLISKVERGVYRESSFAFRVPKDGDKWSEEHDKREIYACELDRGDVSVVTFGASRATGQHMILRSEEALQALQEIGRQQFIEAWKEYREFVSLSPEERVGKIVSSQTAETLRRVLGLIADADDAVDEAEAMLSDFLGVPNPDTDDRDGKPTSAEQLDRVRSEKRDASPLESDRNRTAPHLMDTVLNDLAHAKQHAERLFDSEVLANSGASQFNATHLSRHLDGAQEHAMKLDDHLSQFPSNPEVFRSERERLTSQRAEEGEYVTCPECRGSGSVPKGYGYGTAAGFPGVGGKTYPSNATDDTTGKFGKGFGASGTSAYGKGTTAGFSGKGGKNYPDDSGATAKTGSRAEEEMETCRACEGTGVVFTQRSEERDEADSLVATKLTEAYNALHEAMMAQKADPDQNDPMDAQVWAHLEDAKAILKEALVDQAMDLNSESLDLYDEREDRKALTSKARNSLPSTSFVFPKERRYPIHDISHARNALARASGKPEEAAVKRAVYKRYPSLKPSAKRSELLPNDSEDLLFELKLKG